MTVVKIVTLHPFGAWFLDQVGEDEDATAAYKLTRIGPRKTQLDLRVTEKYKISKAPSKEEDKEATDQMWNKYVVALEKDYSSANYQ
jgi:hypothetical protein